MLRQILAGVPRPLRADDDSGETAPQRASKLRLRSGSLAVLRPRRPPRPGNGFTTRSFSGALDGQTGVRTLAEASPVFSHARLLFSFFPNAAFVWIPATGPGTSGAPCSTWLTFFIGVFTAAHQRTLRQRNCSTRSRCHTVSGIGCSSWLGHQSGATFSAGQAQPAGSHQCAGVSRRTQRQRHRRALREFLLHPTPCPPSSYLGDRRRHVRGVMRPHQSRFPTQDLSSRRCRAWRNMIQQQVRSLLTLPVTQRSMPVLCGSALGWLPGAGACR